MSEYLIYLFLLLQVLYLMFLVMTNMTTTVFILISLKQIMGYFFSAKNVIVSRIINSNNYRPISLLVPAFNEEKTITASVHSFLKLHFPEYEIIVINDGSTDGTLTRLKEEFALEPSNVPVRLNVPHEAIRQTYTSPDYPNLIVVDKGNGGKADALNCGINVSRYPLFCSVDADSLLEFDAILRSIVLFSLDRRLVAIGGRVNVMNGCDVVEKHVLRRAVPNTQIEAFQVLEYTRGFLAGRIAWERFGALLIISGAFGVFRKDMVLSIGGYRHTVGEDFDLLVRMHRHCYDHGIDHTVRFLPDTMCWTQVPTDYKSLLRQRNRWHRGLIETLYYNRDMVFNPKYGKVGMLAMPYYLLIEGVAPLVTFLGLVSIITLYVFGLLNKEALVVFFLLEFTWGTVLNIGALSLDMFVKRRFTKLKDIYRLLVLSFLEPFFYRPILKVEGFLATFNFFNRSWGQIKRKSI
ncbi:glycosyltransferase [Sulfurimonas sp. HSL-3221]|uniref:glycosyltransferase family 2 protein n=1 Tax=Sulfurimonadaceae TaxID=2771471 RepID=UPI001E2B695C|nr:glycosyltransferase family 2 protein [Sulfurimonas sp. HSL-3221]UFS61494.1 glycosyltransferase [Sulfurimonas sp. HSL-3221]